MPSKRKPAYAWAIVTPRGRLDADSIRVRREDAIDLECMVRWRVDVKAAWQKRVADGYRCVKVEIREVGK